MAPAPHAKETSTPPGNGKSRIADHDDPAASSWQHILKLFAELKSHGQYFLAARIDGFKATLHKVILYAIAGAAGAIIGLGLLLTAAFLTLNGLALLIGNAFGGRIWLGQLVVGVGFLAIVGVGLGIALSKMSRNWRQTTERKYERKQSEQRERFGHDVPQRARQARR